MAAETEVTPDQVLSAIEETFGVTPGQRRNHIKGTCATGEFIGNPKAAHVYSRSALFSGRPVPVVARFSLAGGNPKVPDVAKSAQGMALEFSLPHGEFSMMEWLHVSRKSWSVPYCPQLDLTCNAGGRDTIRVRRSRLERNRIPRPYRLVFY